MHFFKQANDIDLGDTPVENIFLNDFMPMANGTHVKVYLLGYKYANDKDSSLTVSHATIAKHLGLPLSDVMDAWDFWEKKGVIRKHPIGEGDPFQYMVEFINLKQLYIDNNYKAVKVGESAEETASGTYSCSPEDLIEANKVPEIKEMFYQVNQLVRRSLVPNEMMEILEWIYNYNMDPDLVIRAFMYCIHQKNIKNVKYVGAVIRNWYDNGITSVQKLDEHLSKTDVRYSQYHQIFKALGFHFREPSAAERKVMDQWLEEWQFTMEVILKACENSKKTSNPNINYIHSILSAWKMDGIQSVEEAEQRQKPEAALAKKTAKPVQNRFHNFEQRTAKYSKDELEKILRKKE
ncbi:DnaD and phage-associated domain-containing protein [Geosporobacter subterraneus DSM 17957]|uniref:DnaD and phage-associated domain-containing protein n=1 Tax=Geosporobacter subterraneus DSM 17957 TaxID=1121919 RepID=A0A1M6KF45_9FIRM|nr:DnaD and phage-associated domain-containing protein [Geosporobacter subterraneus DSM 17957]